MDFWVHGVQANPVLLHIRRSPFSEGKRSYSLYQAAPSSPLSSWVLFHLRRIWPVSVAYDSCCLALSDLRSFTVQSVREMLLFAWYPTSCRYKIACKNSHSNDSRRHLLASFHKCRCVPWQALIVWQPKARIHTLEILSGLSQVERMQTTHPWPEIISSDSVALLRVYSKSNSKSILLM